MTDQDLAQPEAAPTATAPTAVPPPAHGDAADAKKPEEKPGLWKGLIRPVLTVILVVTALRSSLVDWNDVPTGSMIPTVHVGDRIVVNKLAYGFNLPFNGPAFSIPLVHRKEPFKNPLSFLPGFYYGKPEVNDIVTFWKPMTHRWAVQEAIANGSDAEEARELSRVEGGGIRMVKRIVAGPGDTLQMQPATMQVHGRTYHYSAMTLNGEPATYTAIGTRPGDTVLVETVGGHTRRVQYLRNLDPRYSRPLALSFGPVTLGDEEYIMIGDNRDNSMDGRYFGPVMLKEITGKAKFVAVSFEDGKYTNPNWARFFHGFDSDNGR